MSMLVVDLRDETSEVNRCMNFIRPGDDRTPGPLTPLLASNTQLLLSPLQASPSSAAREPTGPSLWHRLLAGSCVCSSSETTTTPGAAQVVHCRDACPKRVRPPLYLPGMQRICTMHIISSTQAHTLWRRPARRTTSRARTRHRLPVPPRRAPGPLVSPARPWMPRTRAPTPRTRRAERLRPGLAEARSEHLPGSQRASGDQGHGRSPVRSGR